ncbi:hypothetical protein [Streptomyces sp. NPDC088915]|uniref:hypothetical protein n=1 Tax=Streptomyces sp. NPDC088915 TaxID=3365912 RepID=UPI003828214C
MTTPTPTTQPAPEAPAAPAVPEAETQTTALAPEAEAVSTPGGLPIIPAVTVGTTGTIATVSASGLAAGGGAAMLAAGALLSVPAAIVAVRAATAARQGRGSRPGARRSARLDAVPSQRPGAGRGSAGGVLRSGAVSGGRSGGRSASGSGSGGRSGGPWRAAGALGASKGRSGAAGAGTGGTAARVRQQAAAVRQTRREAAATAQKSGKSAAAAARTDARRQLADTRRADRRQRREDRRAQRAGLTSTGKGRHAATSRLRAAESGTRSAGPGRLRSAGRAAARTLARIRRGAGSDGTSATQAGTKGGLLRRLRARRDNRQKDQKAPRGFGAARREAYRAARDQIRDRWRTNRRGQIEEKARALARTRALRLSAARHWARRVLAMLAAAPVGALSLAMWPVAKLVRVRPPRWGRAVWRRLSQSAQEARTARDVAAYQDHDQAEADRALAERPAPPGVTRARPSDAPVTTTPKETTMSDQPISDGTGFDFREAATAMLEQAQKAEPGGMMQVLAQVETLPEAMAALAETFAAVAERLSPDNVPLHPEVTGALSDLHKQMLLCVDAGEAVGEVFRTYHEADILRHTDGRTAEELWDVRGQDS